MRKRKNAQQVYFLNSHEAKARQYDIEGDYIGQLEINCTLGIYGGLNLTICQEGDEAFENDSPSVLKIDVFDMLKGCVEWVEWIQKGYYNKQFAYDRVVAELEYMISKKKIDKENYIRGNKDKHAK